MAITEATVQELVSIIERGKLRLPEMQRRCVWRSPRVRDLMDSMYCDIPNCQGQRRSQTRHLPDQRLILQSCDALTNPTHFGMPYQTLLTQPQIDSACRYSSKS